MFCFLRIQFCMVEELCYAISTRWKDQPLFYQTKTIKAQTQRQLWEKVWFKIHLALLRNLKCVKRWQSWPTTGPTLNCAIVSEPLIRLFNVCQEKFCFGSKIHFHIIVSYNCFVMTSVWFRKQFSQFSSMLSQ